MNNKNSGLGLFSVCLVVFVILKLTNLINWSWWWVLSPAWIPLCFWVSFVIVLYVYFKIKR